MGRKYVLIIGVALKAFTSYVVRRNGLLKNLVRNYLNNCYLDIIHGKFKVIKKCNHLLDIHFIQ